MPRFACTSISGAMAAAVAEAIPLPQPWAASRRDLLPHLALRAAVARFLADASLIHPLEVRGVAFELLVGSVLIRHDATERCTRGRRQRLVHHDCGS